MPQISPFLKGWSTSQDWWSTSQDYAIIEDDEVLIKSTPEGNVLDATLKPLGKTPLKVSKSKYLNKFLIISCGEQNKEVKITARDTIKEITFTRSIPQPTSPPSIKEPVIVTFSVNPTNIKSGDEVNLSWDVKNADNINLLKDNEYFKGRLSSTGHEKATLTIDKKAPSKEARKFTLVASNQQNEQVTATKEITVSKKQKDDLWVILVVLVTLIGLGIFGAVTSSNNAFNNDSQLEAMNQDTQSITQVDTQSQLAQYQYYFSNDQITEILKQYYFDNANRDLSSIEKCFSYPIESYYNRGNIDKDSLDSLITSTWALIKSDLNTLDYSSIIIAQDQGNYLITYPLEYQCTYIDGKSYLYKIEDSLKMNPAGEIFYMNGSVQSKELIADSSAYYACDREYNIDVMNDFFLGMTELQVSAEVQRDFNVVPDKEYIKNQGTPTDNYRLSWKSPSSNIITAVYFPAWNVSANTILVFDNNDILNQMVNDFSTHLTSDGYNKWLLSSQTRIELLQGSNGNPEAYISVTPVASSSNSNSSTTNQGGKPGIIVGGTYKAINLAPILRFPDMVKSKEVGKVSNGYVTIISQYNDKYYYVESGGIEGYLFVGWLE